MIDTQHQAQPPSTFGAKLQTARESLNLSRNEAAARLRLNPDIIRALETNDFKKTPHAIFTRGYLRAYARLLRFQDHEIESALNDSGLTITNGDFIAPVLQKKDNFGFERYMHFLSGFIALVLFGLIAVWWKIHTKPELQIALPVAQQTTPASASPPVTAPTAPTTATVAAANTPPAMVPVVLPDQKPAVTVADNKQPAKNPRQKPPLKDMINTFSEPGLEPSE
ncbi:MAG: helix-turn-helix domain-containing protein [Gammaproteobacteria bacterium]|nr:helix-turn-helix domain-containing protein [Gammaproteobacteria bacterium]